MKPSRRYTGHLYKQGGGASLFGKKELEGESPHHQHQHQHRHHHHQRPLLASIVEWGVFLCVWKRCRHARALTSVTAAASCGVVDVCFVCGGTVSWLEVVLMVIWGHECNVLEWYFPDLMFYLRVNFLL